jgi:hypothetical protein
MLSDVKGFNFLARGDVRLEGLSVFFQGDTTNTSARSVPQMPFSGIPLRV